MVEIDVDSIELDVEESSMKDEEDRRHASRR